MVRKFLNGHIIHLLIYRSFFLLQTRKPAVVQSG